MIERDPDAARADDPRRPVEAAGDVILGVANAYLLASVGFAGDVVP
jgi:hypothetical protein